jgi:predicted Fe-Mo cluster-binding NifX family protein
VRKEVVMRRIAVPTLGKDFSSHFGGADSFAVFEVGDDGTGIKDVNRRVPPTHGQGVFPNWLRSLGVSVVLVGCMGWRAKERFESCDIEVIMGIKGGSPEELVESYLRGELRSTGSTCYGGFHHDCDERGERPG